PSVELLSGATPAPFRRQFDRLERAGAGALAARLRAMSEGRQHEVHQLEAPDEWMSGGERFPIGDRTLEAIPTPGHTRGHVVFVEREAGLLFAGDHVLPHITPSIGFEVNPPVLALRDYLQSLRMVRAMPDMTLL